MAGVKQCSACSEFKLPDFFNKKSAKCKPCASRATQAWRAANPERAKESVALARSKYSTSKKNGYRIRHRYGLTLDQLESMRAAQEEKCAICKTAFTKTPSIDHCHSKGHVRGLLCDHCNRGLGYFRDNPDSLLAAVEYLRNSP